MNKSFRITALLRISDDGTDWEPSLHDVNRFLVCVYPNTFHRPQHALKINEPERKLILPPESTFFFNQGVNTFGWSIIIQQVSCALSFFAGNSPSSAPARVWLLWPAIGKGHGHGPPGRLPSGALVSQLILFSSYLKQSSLSTSSVFVSASSHCRRLPVLIHNYYGALRHQLLRFLLLFHRVIIQCDDYVSDFHSLTVRRCKGCDDLICKVTGYGMRGGGSIPVRSVGIILFTTSIKALCPT
jgi:hypothetical protein